MKLENTPHTYFEEKSANALLLHNMSTSQSYKIKLPLLAFGLIFLLYKFRLSVFHFSLLYTQSDNAMTKTAWLHQLSRNDKKQ